MVMSGKKDFEQCCNSIFEALEKNDRIDEMVADMSAVLSIPIAVVDPCGIVLVDTFSDSISNEHAKDKKPWLQIVEEYYAANDVLRGNWMKESETEVLIMNPILIKGILEGFCITFHDNKEHADKLNKMICRTITIGLSWKKQIYGYRDSGARQIVSRILLGKNTDRDDIPKINEEVFQKYVVSPYILVVIQTRRDSLSDILHVRSKISDRYENVLVCVDKGEITILFTQVYSKLEEKRIWEFLDELTKEMEGRCAVSAQFLERDQIRGKRKMMERLLSIGESMEDQKVVYLENDYYEKLICSFAYEAMGAKGYGTRDLDRLEKEDKEKGTEFYRSLKEYLLAGNNVNLSAKRLFIHRNTMVYRLAKIHELIELDINQPDVSRRLLLTMFLREFESH